MSRLAHRLEGIPGVAAVEVDLSDDGGGINIKLDPGADELQVMERLRTVLVAYGVRSERPLPVESLPGPAMSPLSPIGVKVRITPIEHGARVEVESKSVRSFRIVPASRLAIAQGLADAWSQVVGRVPTELTAARLENGVITVGALTEGGPKEGSGAVSDGWQTALAVAVGRAIGTVAE